MHVLNIFCVWFQMNLLLKEYLTSGDVLEAERCLRDLEVPHFHHELVYEVKKKKSEAPFKICLAEM